MNLAVQVHQKSKKKFFKKIERKKGVRNENSLGILHFKKILKTLKHGDWNRG
jgi:hypothetical protein